MWWTSWYETNLADKGWQKSVFAEFVQAVAQPDLSLADEKADSSVTDYFLRGLMPGGLSVLLLFLLRARTLFLSTTGMCITQTSSLQYPNIFALFFSFITFKKYPFWTTETGNIPLNPKRSALCEELVSFSCSQQCATSQRRWEIGVRNPLHLWKHL